MLLLGMTRTDITKAWKSLGLEILQPAELSNDRLWDIKTKFHDPEFRDQLPIAIAHVEPNAQAHYKKMAMAAAEQNPLQPITSPELARAFTQDIEKINLFFYGTGIQRTDTHVGRFNRDTGNEGQERDTNRDAHIHADCFGATSQPMYLTRMLGLPFGFIRRVDVQAAPEDTKRIVTLAQTQDMRPELGATGLLQHAELGAVMLMATRAGTVPADPTRLPPAGGGTLHCRATIPPEPERRISALARAVSLPINLPA